MVERKWWLWGLQQEMMRQGVELFHGTDFSVPYLPLRPSVITIHDLSPWLDRAWQPQSRRIRRRTPLLLRAGLAAMVITPSQAIRSAVMQRFRLPSDRVVAVPLAASEHFHRVEMASAAVPYFLFTGTLEPRKNIARLVEAWREVRKKHAVDLVLAGRCAPIFVRSRRNPACISRARSPKSDLPALYSGALAVVYPSLYEGFGLPVLEAMQCGALVITSRDPAIVGDGGRRGGSRGRHDTRGLGEALAAIADAPLNFAALRERAAGAGATIIPGAARPS